MVEKQASSEIAQSRGRFLEIKQRALVAIGNFLEAKGSRNVDVFTALPCIVVFTQREIEDAERDTRERCAQIAEHFLDELTAEEFPPHGLNKASMRWDSGHSEQFVKWVAERIRGKE